MINKDTLSSAILMLNDYIQKEKKDIAHINTFDAEGKTDFLVIYAVDEKAQQLYDYIKEIQNV